MEGKKMNKQTSPANIYTFYVSALHFNIRVGRSLTIKNKKLQMSQLT